MLLLAQINLDSKTRETTLVNVQAPNRETFEVAQRRIQHLMEKDSYPRFLNSKCYIAITGGGGGGGAEKGPKATKTKALAKS